MRSSAPTPRLTPTTPPPSAAFSPSGPASSDASSSTRAGSISRTVLTLLLCLGPAGLGAADYVGSQACRACHLPQYQAQASTGHAGALSRAGRPGAWNFGSGLQAVTPVSRTGPELYQEHGLTRYTRTKREGITPGHKDAKGVFYPLYNPGAEIFKCFQCHSTGPLRLDAKTGIEPFEAGVRCEVCHGPGSDHAKAPSRLNVFNPKMLNAAGVNEACGACHRQPPKAGEDTNWSEPWNARHQPLGFSQSACFRKSEGRLTCLTCHDPHGARPVRGNEVCSGCHQAPRHARPQLVRGQSCAGCHMPPVKPSPDLRFANHWIGIYAPGNPLLPVASSSPR